MADHTHLPTPACEECTGFIRPTLLLLRIRPTCQQGGRDKEAYAALYKSTWNYAWRAPGYYALAQVGVTRSCKCIVLGLFVVTSWPLVPAALPAHVLPAFCWSPALTLLALDICKGTNHRCPHPSLPRWMLPVETGRPRRSTAAQRWPPTPTSCRLKTCAPLCCAAPARRQKQQSW